METLAVPPKEAFAAIGVGVTKGYELINSGELESFTIGTARRVTIKSIEAFVERRLAASPDYTAVRCPPLAKRGLDL